MLFVAPDHLFSLSMVISVISGGANRRIGGPQVPAPRLTYSRRPSASLERPVCTHRPARQVNEREYLAAVDVSGELQVEWRVAINYGLVFEQDDESFA